MKHLFLLKATKQHHEFASKIPPLMQGYDYQIIYTHSVKEMQNTILQLKDPSRLYIVGGDGTLHALIQVCVHTPHEVVVVPLGTGNDFNRCLTQQKDPYQIIKQSLTLNSHPIDTVLVNDQYYINAACFGVDSVIANHVHDTHKTSLIPESSSYLVSIMKHIFTYPYYPIQLYIQDQCVYEGPITLCTLNNGRYYGGGFLITPQSQIDDGYIDICIVDQVPHHKIPYLFSLLITHHIKHRPELHYYKVKEATIISQHSSNLDGERYKSDTYHFKIQPQSLHLVYPKKP